MKYTIGIDWLSLFCLYKEPSETWTGVTRTADTLDACYPWAYRKEPYGTRQYKGLMTVSMPNEQGGFDDFAQVQYGTPTGSVLNPCSVIVKFDNRVLYRRDFWELADRFLHENEFIVQSVSRIDICADFNQFAEITPGDLIHKFANKELRHVGRGVGALYFDHGLMKKPGTTEKEYGVHYTGLSFGTHASDARVYLYNKSFELATQHDKPWIRDQWHGIGLDVREVWRLEVSIKSKARTFKSKTFGDKVTIDTANTRDHDQLRIIYHTFVQKLFAFVRNRPGITNITREPRIKLFTDNHYLDRQVIRNVSSGNRLEKMVIKSLWQMGDLYRGEDARGCAGYAETLAEVIAHSTDLGDWMRDKVDTWSVPAHK